MKSGSMIMKEGIVCVKYSSSSSPAFILLCLNRERAKPPITERIIATTEDVSVTKSEFLKYCPKLLYENNRW